ncbi:MAG TPA: EutP/PduV family microcompartment system protein [Negativicutes bacterium]
MSNKILLIGGVGAGKTSLKQKLLCQTLIYRKTQVLEFSNLFVDCPGEYLEMPKYYHVLIDTSHRVAEVWALQDATRRRSFYPPNFAQAFRKPVIGIITKIDKQDACATMAENFLRQAGISDVMYHVSAQNDEGIDALVRHLEVVVHDS